MRINGRKFECEFRYSNRFNPERIWSVVGSRMAMHLHFTDLGEGTEYRFSGGVEFHWRTPPAHMVHDPPSNKSCWLLGCPCWHDGTSTWATEHWIPLWRREISGAPDEHERMFELLALELINAEARAESETEQ